MHKAKVVAIATIALVAATATSWWSYNRHTCRADGTCVEGVGEQRRFELHFRTQLAQPGQKEPLTIMLDGDWVTTVIAVRDGERDFACEITNARVSGGGVANVPVSEVEALARRLSQRFWVTYRGDGTPLRVHFPKNVSPSDRNLLMMIVTEMQLVRPAKETTTWTTRERDGAGTYFAVYQRPPDRQGVIVKRKLKYIDARGAVEATGGSLPATGSLDLAVLSSERNFKVDDSGKMTAVDGSEHVRVGMPMVPMTSATSTEGMSHLDISTELHLSNVRVAVAPELAGSLVRARSAVDSVPVGTQASDPEQVLETSDRQLLEGYSTEALLESAKATQSDPYLPARLAALFRRHPEAIPAGVKLIRAGDRDALLTNALGAAGTESAINALGGLARDRATPPNVRIDAVNALVQLSRPSPASVQIAMDLLDEPDLEVRRAARLVAGALGYALRTANPAAQEAIERALVGRYETATVLERADLLEGLGNSGGPLTLTTVDSVLRDEHVEVRVAAAHALRRIDEPDADRRLAAVITDDLDWSVRRAGVSSAEVRWPERSTALRTARDPLVAAILHAAVADPDSSVRAQAVGVLRRRQHVAPEISAALKQVAEHDKHSGVRRLASEALAERPVPPKKK